MWKDYFAFTRGERYGIIVLVLLIFIVFGAKKLMFLFSKNKTVDVEQFIEQINKWESTLKEKDNAYYENRLNRYIVERYDSIDLFPFDPNTVAQTDLKKLGFTDKQTQSILKYRDRGGQFFDKEDFKKMYGIRAKQFEIVEPYIKIENIKKEYNLRFPEKNKSKDFTPDSLFNFDPNDATDWQMQALGFSTGQIQTIKNYRSKGGQFFKNEDLQKIYGIQEEQFKILETYIEIKKVDSLKMKEDDLIITQIDANKADSTSLMQITGLRAYQAKNIIKYRDLLGGFVSKEQLREVYGMKDYTYNKIAPYINVDAEVKVKMNINFSEVRELIKHPYIDYAKAKSIIDYRTQHGSYKNVETLLQEKVLLEEDYLQILPYITVK